MARFRKKPVEIEAVQLRWDTWGEVCDFAPVGKVLHDGEWVDQPVAPTDQVCRGVAVHPTDNTQWSEQPGSEDRIGLLIPTLEGVMLAVEDDWIIRGVQGEFYPCKPDIFDATYEPVEGPS